MLISLINPQVRSGLPFQWKAGPEMDRGTGERMLSTLHSSDWMKEEYKLRNGELSVQQ